MVFPSQFLLHSDLSQSALASDQAIAGPARSDLMKTDVSLSVEASALGWNATSLSGFLGAASTSSGPSFWCGLCAGTSSFYLGQKDNCALFVFSDMCNPIGNTYPLYTHIYIYFNFVVQLLEPTVQFLQLVWPLCSLPSLNCYVVVNVVLLLDLSIFLLL